jgi:hypothetical protein
VSLGDSAVNSTGSRPTPDAIVQAWQPLPERLALAGVTSVERRGARDLRFVFARPNDSLPAILADPVLAFRRSALMPTDSTSAPALRILPPPPDLRDALDAGRDIVVTADPATLDYARRQPELEVAPLPWSSVYALVAPEAGSIAADDRLRSSLARDVVREDARPAPASYGRGGCAPGTAGAAPPATPTQRTRLAYVAADPTAASLAARLVALGAAGPRGAALALEQPEIRRRLQHGELAGAVVPLPALAVANCGSADFAGYTVTPLVETRAHLIARRGGPAIRRDAFGVLRIDGGSASP